MRRAAAWLLIGFGLTLSTGLIAAEPRSRTEQVEFTEQAPLFDAAGNLFAWGWARRAKMQYDRSLIPAARQARVKEWEHYTVMSPEFTLGVTLAQLGPLVLASAELIDYRDKSIATATFMSAGKKDKSRFFQSIRTATRASSAERISCRWSSRATSGESSAASARDLSACHSKRN